MAFAETLQRLRKRASLSQVQLAEAARVPVDTLRSWEHGRHLPRIDHAFWLARALGVRLQTLVRPADMEAALRETNGNPARSNRVNKAAPPERKARKRT